MRDGGNVRELKRLRDYGTTVRTRGIRSGRGVGEIDDLADDLMDFGVGGGSMMPMAAFKVVWERGVDEDFEGLN